MKQKSTITGLWIGVMVCLSIISGAHTVDAGFEGGVPSAWKAAKGSLSVSADHYKEGVQSLRWDWVGGDSLIVTGLQAQGLVPSEVFAYYQNTFRMWVYSPADLQNDSVRIEFYDTRGELQYFYYFYPNFTGWRSVAISYRFEMFGEKRSYDLDRMVIYAPARDSGLFFFDYVDFTTDRITFSSNSYHLPYKRANGDHWSHMMYYETLEKTVPLMDPSPRELDDLETIRAVYMDYVKGTPPSASVMQFAENRFNAMKISYRSDGSIKGFPLFGGDYSDGENVHVVNEVLLSFARDYRFTHSLSSKRRFMILVRHMLDQGYARGSVMETVHHIGYDYRNVPLAVFLMKEELVAEGIWTEAREMVEWFIALEGIWEPEAEKSDMDAGNTRAIQRLGACLFQETPAEQVQYLKGFQHYLENWLTLYPRPGEGMKPDYTGFHHNFYYASRYVHPAYYSIAFTIKMLQNSVYAVGESYQDILIKALQVGRLSAGGTDLPISLAGRGSMLTNLGSALHAVKNLADAAGSDDNRMAAMYNYYHPNTYQGVTPEPVPEGFWQINFSPLGIYRKENWVVHIKGFNNNFLGAEIYVDAGRYSRYLGYGTTEVLYEDGYEASGRREEGWDWNIIPGTTTIHLPFEKLKAEAARQDETTLSEFAGALRFGSKEHYYLQNEEQLEGTTGIYGMDFRQKAISTTHNPSFTFQKSMFCIDDMVVCLGSGITNDDAKNATRTNLFQVYLKSINDPVVIDQMDQRDFPRTETLEAGTHWMIDPYGTGFLTRGSDRVIVRKQTQTSPDQSGNGQTTMGNFAAAWIDHGVAPQQASYEFVIVPGATKERMTALMAGSDTLYQVLQKDAMAHIIQRGDWQGHVLFAANGSLERGRILSNSARCLVISGKVEGTNHLQVAVADPSIDFGEGVSAVDEWVELEFHGIWSLDKAYDNVVVLDYRPDITRVKVRLSQGEPADFRLISEKRRVEMGALLNDAFMQGAAGYNTTMIRMEPAKRDGYLMFGLSGPVDSITGMELWLSPVGAAGSGAMALYQGDHNRWSENDLSEVNRPREGALLARLDTLFEPGQWYRWIIEMKDWSPNDTITLILKQESGTPVNFVSKENTLLPEMKPQLVAISQHAQAVSSRPILMPVKGSIQAYPNPFHNGLTVQWDGDDDIKTIAVFDVTGKLVGEYAVSDEDKRELTLLKDQGDIPEGIYFIRIYRGRDVQTLRIVKVDRVK